MYGKVINSVSNRSRKELEKTWDTLAQLNESSDWEKVERDRYRKDRTDRANNTAQAGKRTNSQQVNW